MKKICAALTAASLLAGNLASTYAWAADPKTCTPVCEQYRGQMDACKIAKPAAGSPGAGQTELTHRLDGLQSSCDSKVTMWNQVGPHCDSMKSSEVASDAENLGFIYYTIAAVACTLGCAAQLTVIGSAEGQLACTLLGGAASLAEIGTLFVTNEKFQAISDSAGMAGGLAATLAAPVATRIGGDSVKATAQKIAACAAAGFFVIAAATKKDNENASIDLTAKACDNVLSLQSQAQAADAAAAAAQAAAAAAAAAKKAGAGAGGGGSGIGGGSSSNPGIAVGGGGKAGTGSSRSAMSAISGLANGEASGSKFATAIAGPLAPVLTAMNNKEKLPQTINKLLGTTDEEMARAISQGATASSILAAAGGDLAKMGEGLKAIEDDYRAGRIAFAGGAPGAGLMTAGGGGKGGASGGAKPGLGLGALFGAGGGGGSAAGGDLKFDPRKEPIPAADGDIWHEGYGGTIFQIVSQKLARNRARIDQLEWESPLNRALAGLPAKKPPPGGRK